MAFLDKAILKPGKNTKEKNTQKKNTKIYGYLKFSMNKETFNRHYFSQTEAEEKIGKRIQTRVDFSGVPKGSIGTVINADPAGVSKIGDITENVYDVAIQWDSQTTQVALASRLEQADENENTIERTARREQLLEEQDRLLFIQSDKPLVDWFTKDEYERYLEELPKITDNLISR